MVWGAAAVVRETRPVAVRFARVIGGALGLMVILASCSDSSRPALQDDSTRDEFGRIVEPGRVGVLRLQPGDCFVAGADEIEAVSAVPCVDEHDSEVLAVFDLPDAAWPGANAVQTAAREGCLDRFEAATGYAYDAAVTELTAYAPTHISWADDRSVICVGLSPDGSLIRGGLSRAGA